MLCLQKGQVLSPGSSLVVLLLPWTTQGTQSRNVMDTWRRPRDVRLLAMSTHLGPRPPPRALPPADFHASQVSDKSICKGNRLPMRLAEVE